MINKLSTIVILITILFLSSLTFSLTKAEKKKLVFYDKIITALSQVAPKQKIQKLILNRRVRFRPKLILLNLNQPNSKKYFNDSLGKKAVLKGKRFFKRYHKTLAKVEKKFSVDKEVIVAILYIESNFKPHKARYNVFNAYSSLAYADHPIYLKRNLKKIKRIYRKLSPEKFILKKKEFIERSKWKAEWAINQLIALFSVAQKMKLSILKIKGSFAGAIGYPQFIPSSYLKYAVDGNNDNFIDLYNIHDAIASVGNYLNIVGYKKGNLESQRQAIHHYNKHWDYVQVVIDYAKLLNKSDKLKGE